jgi:hypothetical protein
MLEGSCHGVFATVRPAISLLAAPALGSVAPGSERSCRGAAADHSTPITIDDRLIEPAGERGSCYEFVDRPRMSGQARSREDTLAVHAPAVIEVIEVIEEARG